MPVKPTTHNKAVALMVRQAVMDGQSTAVMPEVGKRISLKPDTVRQIRRLAQEGMHCSAIARATGLRESGVRRYARDYHISLPAGDRGGPSAARLRAIEARQRNVLRLLEAGWTQRAIAKHLNVSTFTINRDAQYVRRQRAT